LDYYFPARRRREPDLDACESDAVTREEAVRFLFNVLNSTIYSSGENYDKALEDFFPQLEALGHLIGAESIDDISLFLRRSCRPL
jgi:hypothetical protein